MVCGRSEKQNNLTRATLTGIFDGRANRDLRADRCSSSNVKADCEIRRAGLVGCEESTGATARDDDRYRDNGARKNSAS
jgi:hypothetical protein